MFKNLSKKLKATQVFQSEDQVRTKRASNGGIGDNLCRPPCVGHIEHAWPNKAFRLYDASPWDCSYCYLSVKAPLPSGKSSRDKPPSVRELHGAKDAAALLDLVRVVSAAHGGITYALPPRRPI